MGFDTYGSHILLIGTRAYAQSLVTPTPRRELRGVSLTASDSITSPSDTLPHEPAAAHLATVLRGDPVPAGQHDQALLTLLDCSTHRTLSCGCSREVLVPSRVLPLMAEEYTIKSWD